MGLIGLALGTFVRPGFLALPATVGAAVFLSGTRGIYPLLPIFRRLASVRHAKSSVSATPSRHCAATSTRWARKGSLVQVRRASSASRPCATKLDRSTPCNCQRRPDVWSTAPRHS